jgi:hypothetical protein
MRGIMMLLALMLAAWSTTAVAQENNYEWMGGSGDGNFTLSYGSPETAEDQLFWLVCRNSDKKTELVVYVDMHEVKLGQPIDIEFAAGTTKATVKGKVATDEMSGFLFAKADQFPIKPVLGVLAAKGPVTVKTGDIETTLPPKGRGPDVAKFAKGCKLN